MGIRALSKMSSKETIELRSLFSFSIIKSSIVFVIDRNFVWHPFFLFKRYLYK